MASLRLTSEYQDKHANHDDSEEEEEEIKPRARRTHPKALRHIIEDESENDLEDSTSGPVPAIIEPAPPPHAPRGRSWLHHRQPSQLMEVVITPRKKNKK